jgi:hypothetical protein
MLSMSRYDAYLLRVWRSDHGDEARWAGRLEHLPDGAYQRFVTLEELLIALRQLLAGERAAAAGAVTPAAREAPSQQ